MSEVAIAHRKSKNAPHARTSQVSTKWVRTSQLATAHRNSQLAIAHRKSCLGKIQCDFKKTTGPICAIGLIGDDIIITTKCSKCVVVSLVFIQFIKATLSSTIVGKLFS